MGKGKFKSLFKKKEGGSALGNAFRFVGDKFSGGLVSSLFPRPTDADLKKGDPIVTVANAQPSFADVDEQMHAQKLKELAKEKTQKVMKIVGIVVGALVILGVAFKLLFKKKKR